MSKNLYEFFNEMAMAPKVAEPKAKDYHPKVEGAYITIADQLEEYIDKVLLKKDSKSYRQPNPEKGALPVVVAIPDGIRSKIEKASRQAQETLEKKHGETKGFGIWFDKKNAMYVDEILRKRYKKSGWKNVHINFNEKTKKFEVLLYKQS